MSAGPVRTVPPRVILGHLEDGGIAPAVAAIVDRGVQRRPSQAAGLRCQVELQIIGPYPPVRITFGDVDVLVEDGSAEQPDVRVSGGLADLISLMETPLLGGLPSFMNARGRAAIGRVALGKVRIEGRIGLMRRLLSIVRF